MVVDMPSGTAAGKLYLIHMEEDLWKGLDPDRQAFCKAQWTEKATAIPEVRFVVLKLVPDELFPVHGHDKPYVEWQEAIDRPPECGFERRVELTLCITGDGKLNPVMRAEMTGYLVGHVKGTRYCILNEIGDVFERGIL